MKRLILLYFVLFSFLYFGIGNVFALQIRNVNSNASNNNDRWIEVFNDGSDIIDFTITDYKVLDSKDTTKHGITTLLGDATFPANTSIFISPSINIPTGATKVFRSNYTLDKTSGYISLINSDGSSTYSCLAYGGVSCPNSNVVNNPSNNSTSTNQSSTSTSVTSTNTDPATNVVYIYIPTNNQNKYGDITVLLPEEKLIPAGADTEFNVKAIDQDKKVITGLDFEWSFGDGGEKFGQKVSHHYAYPGEYTLVASADGYAVGGEAKMSVKVITPDISISKIGAGEKENFIDLTNNTDYDLVLSNFYLNIDNNFYKLPKNFTISKRKTVHVSGEALGFKLPATNISLNYPNKNLLISYLNIPTASTSNILETSIPKAEYGFNVENITQKDEDINTEPIITEPKVESKKDISESFTIKRLILNNTNKENIKKDIPLKNLNKKPNVDTGIVDWFKSLIY